MVGIKIALQRTNLVFVLTAGCLCGQFAIGMDVVEHHLQVAACGIEQRWPVEEAGDGDEAAVGQG